LEFKIFLKITVASKLLKLIKKNRENDPNFFIKEIKEISVEKYNIGNWINKCKIYHKFTFNGEGKIKCFKTSYDSSFFEQIFKDQTNYNNEDECDNDDLYDNEITEEEDSIETISTNNDNVVGSGKRQRNIICSVCGIFDNLPKKKCSKCSFTSYILYDS
jgi:hypothetical protein